MIVVNKTIHSVPHNYSTSTDTKQQINNEPVIQPRSGQCVRGEYANKALDILMRVYSARAAESKSTRAPHVHAWDRYFNPNAPHFIHGLTDLERQIGLSKETALLHGTTFTSLSFQDANLRDFPVLYGDTASAINRLNNRSAVNLQLQELFRNNNIFVPDNVRLRFILEPPLHKLRVEGTDDKSLISQIEELLNSSGNSSQLFMHIILSRDETSTQFTKDNLRKYRIERTIREYTGFLLRDLQEVNGRFLTPDGRDIFDLFSRALEKDIYVEGEHRGAFRGHVREELNWLAQRGFNNIPDLVLEIEFENGFLLDVGQANGLGPGQTGWMNSLPGFSQLGNVR